MRNDFGFNLNKQDLRKALKRMKGAMKTFDENANSKMLESLADFGVKRGRELYKAAKYDGVNDVKLKKERAVEHTWNICISGKALAPIEYGSGVQSIDPDSAFNPHRVGMLPGLRKRYYKWSRDKNGNIVTTKGGKQIRERVDYWFYTAKPGDKLKAGGQKAYKRNSSGTSRITKGNPPQHIENQLYREIKGELQQRVKEMMKESKRK